MAERDARDGMPVFEGLEDRLLLTIATPLVIGGTTVGTFTDSDGDDIVIRISGTAGRVVITEDITDGIGDDDGILEDGEEIGTVTITGARGPFRLVYSVEAVGGAGVCLMGAIASDRIIQAIDTVPAAAGGQFDLYSFTGPGFLRNGGMAVDNILGDAAGVALAIGPLGVGNYIDVRGDVVGTGTIRGDCGGVVNIGGTTTGAWTITGTLGARGSLIADNWDLTIGRDMAGQVTATEDDLALVVGRDMVNRARATADGDIDLTVGRNVCLDAVITSMDSDIDAVVGLNSTGRWEADETLTLTIGGGIRGGRLIGNSDVDITVTGNVAGANIFGGSGGVLTVGGTLSNSTVDGGDGTLEVTTGGHVMNSRLISTYDDMTLAIGGDATVTTIATGGNLFGFIAGNARAVRATAYLDIGEAIDPFDIGGNVGNSTFASGDGSTFIDIGGSTSIVTLTGSDELVATVGGSAARTNFLADEGAVDATIGTDWVSGQATASDDVTMVVGRDVGRDTFIQAGDDGTADLTVGRDFGGKASAGSGTIVAAIGRNVADSAQFTADDITLGVGGNLGGVVHANDELDLLVGGSALRSATIQGDVLNDLDGDGLAFDITGHMLGTTQIGSLDGWDVTIGGNANRIVIGGEVDSDIVIGGFLTYLSSSSFFDPVTATTGDFCTGDAVPVVTGTLTTGTGWRTVTPLL